MLIFPVHGAATPGRVFEQKCIALADEDLRERVCGTDPHQQR